MAPIQEEQTPHTGLLRLGLAVPASRIYWERAGSGLEIPNRQESWYPKLSAQRERYLLRQMQRRFPHPWPAEILSRPTLTANLVCHWHLQLTDPLYRHYTGDYLLKCWSSGTPAVSLEGTAAWVEKSPVAADWKPNTVRRLASGLMSSASAAGLCDRRGRSERELRLPVVSAADLHYLNDLLDRAQSLGDRSYYRVSVGLTDEGNYE